MLARLREHAAAPIYRNFSGHRLSRRDQWRARLQNAWLRCAATQSAVAAPPAWIWPWLLRHQHSVAAWPTAARWLRGWPQLPTMNRADLQARLAQHMPQQWHNSALLCFTTSGTTGHPIRVPSTPLAAAAYQALHDRALALHGVQLQAGAHDVGVVLAGFQQRCFTYVSVNPLRGECGLAKLNLHPDEWRHADDRVRYLDDLRPELMSGDPVSLAAWRNCRCGTNHVPCCPPPWRSAKVCASGWKSASRARWWICIR
jgi:phenylacetate-CoA ligase